MILRLIGIGFCCLPLLSGGQNDVAHALRVRLNAGSDQWLMQVFEEERGAELQASACDYKPAPSLNLPERECEAWLKTKEMCDLLFPLFRAKTGARDQDANYAYLALVASGLDMHAQHAPGRAGIWQLTYPIAIKYGLEINDVLDERLAPDRATDAALEYLADLEQRFPSDPEKVKLAFLTSVPLVEKMDGLSDEGRTMLEQLSALRTWYESRPRKGFLLDVIGILNQHENVVFQQDVSYATLTEALDVPNAVLHGANPAFVGERIPALYRDMPFILPASAVARMTALGDSLYTWEARKQAEEEARRKAAEKKHTPPAGDAITYTVRSGDVLGKIAQRHGVRVSEIKAWNGLRSDRIDIGQKLVIYPQGKPKATSTASSPPPPAPKSSPQNTVTGQTYTVKSGDSLWLIARKFPGVSADDIMRHNGISNDIQPGQVLKIPKAQ